jgi:hypothetical protein
VPPRVGVGRLGAGLTGISGAALRDRAEPGWDRKRVSYMAWTLPRRAATEAPRCGKANFADEGMVSSSPFRCQSYSWANKTSAGYAGIRSSLAYSARVGRSIVRFPRAVASALAKPMNGPCWPSVAIE